MLMHPRLKICWTHQQPYGCRSSIAPEAAPRRPLPFAELLAVVRKFVEGLAEAAARRQRRMRQAPRARAPLVLRPRNRRGGLVGRPKGAEALCGLARIPSDCEHDGTQPAAAGTHRSRRPLMVAQREPAKDGLGGSAVSSAADGSDSPGLGDSDSDIGCCRKRLR